MQSFYHGKIKRVWLPSITCHTRILHIAMSACRSLCCQTCVSRGFCSQWLNYGLSITLQKSTGYLSDSIHDTGYWALRNYISEYSGQQRSQVEGCTNVQKVSSVALAKTILKKKKKKNATHHSTKLVRAVVAMMQKPVKAHFLEPDGVSSELK